MMRVYHLKLAGLKSLNARMRCYRGLHTRSKKKRLMGSTKCFWRIRRLCKNFRRSSIRTKSIWPHICSKLWRKPVLKLWKVCPKWTTKRWQSSTQNSASKKIKTKVNQFTLRPKTQSFKNSATERSYKYQHRSRKPKREIMNLIRIRLLCLKLLQS